MPIGLDRWNKFKKVTTTYVEVAGGFPVAQYVYDIVDVDGLRFPTKRRAYLRGPHLKAIRDMLLVSITYDSKKFRLD
jgi:hypothetical protein